MNWYLFAGYAIFWALIFAYIVFLHRKQERLGQDLRGVAESLKE